MELYSELKEFSETIALYAGEEILLKGFVSADKKISYKSSTDLVTDTDRASEEFIVAEISRNFPDHDVIAEEGGGHSSDKDYVWLIDPLDATNNFAHGIPHFCVSIAVFSRSLKKTVAGAVYDPVRKELFSSAMSQGASLNGKKMSVSAIDSLDVSLLATGFPYLKSDARINNVSQFSSLLPRVQCIRRMGSAALDLCYVAAGRLEGYWEPMLKSWDMAAGVLFVEQAGGAVTNYKGGMFSPFVPELVATNGKIHELLLESLAGSTEFYPRDFIQS